MIPFTLMRMKRRFILVSSLKGIRRGHVMSSFVRRSLIAAVGAALLGGGAGAQLLPSVRVPMPPVSLPTRDIPVAGPTLGTILAQPDASEVVAPTLDTVAGLPERLAQASPAT